MRYHNTKGGPTAKTYYTSQPEYGGCGERNGGQEALRASVVTCGDAPVIPATRHDLDPVAAAWSGADMLDT